MNKKIDEMNDVLIIIKDYFEELLNEIPVHQIVKSDCDKEYACLNPVEIMMEYNILEKFNKDLVDEYKKNHLMSLCNYLRKAKAGYYNSDDAKANIYTKAYIDDCKEALNSEHVFTEINMEDIISYSSISKYKYSNVDFKAFELTRNAINDMFNNQKLKDLMRFKNFGEYSNYTPYQFIIEYIIYNRVLNNQVDFLQAKEIINDIYKLNIDLADESLSAETKEFRKKRFENKLIGIELDPKFDLRKIACLTCGKVKEANNEKSI